jgi:hypothetical protein
MSKDTIGKMLALPENMRNTMVYTDEYLSNLQKLTVRNSLNVVKIMMMTAGGKTLDPKMRILPDYTNSLQLCLALQIK